jgi:hypothetical protein
LWQPLERYHLCDLQIRQRHTNLKNRMGAALYGDSP